MAVSITFVDGTTVIPANWLNYVNTIVNGGIGTGSVTSVSVTSANGFAGTVATATTTPAITLTTTITGLLKGNGTAISAATNADLPAMTATVGGAVPTPPNNTTTFLRGDGTFATIPAGGTVTNTGGNLTANSIVLGAGTVDTKVVAGITTDGTSKLTLGVAGASVGSVDFKNATSGTVTLAPVTGALGSVTLSLPAATDTLVGKSTTDTLTNKTLVAPALGTPASGTLSSCTVDGTSAVGFREIPQNSKSAAYTTVLADNGKHVFHPTADVTARTFTIDSNANVAYPIGTAITFINQNGAGVVTIAITTDTMRLAGAGTTGSRTLAANGVATAIKVTSTEWIISGTGLT